MCNFRGYILIDSDDRNNKPNSDASDITFNVNFRANIIDQIAMTAYDFIIAFDNINENNQIAYIDDGTATYPVLIPTRTYNLQDLAGQVKLELDAIGLGAWNVVLNQGKFDIVAPVAVQFLSNPVKPNGRDWADMIGMPKETGLITIFKGNIADITYTNKLYITCQDLHQYKTLTDESSNRRVNNVLAVVYVNENAYLGNENESLEPKAVYPHHATRDINNPKWIKHRIQSDIGVLRVVLLDDRGEQIPPSQRGNIRWFGELMIQ